ncbi:MAG TPA: hypothetical protein VFY36_07530, partial [Solirubrobacteraceae bacterium]|nr:hypothetical protein [Solirubrobacteraceae bacterium]
EPTVDKISGTVSWQPPSGEPRPLPFYGTVTGGTILEGVLLDGFKQVTVSGTIAEDGSVSGTIKADDGSPMGTFGSNPDSATSQPTIFTVKHRI